MAHGNTLGDVEAKTLRDKLADTLNNSRAKSLKEITLQRGS